MRQRRPPAQMTFAFDARQPRHTWREGLRLWTAIERLRRVGLSVYRHGPTQHLVDGRIMSTRELIRLTDRTLGN